MGAPLKILMIGSDRKLLEEGSAVSARIKEYGKLVEELHIVLLSNASHGLKEAKITENVWVYPTNSMASFLRPLDAVSLGKKIVFNNRFVRGKSLITAQDIESGWAGLRIKKKWRIPLEVQLHTDPFSPYFGGFQNKVRKFFAGSVLRGADSIRVVSEFLKSKVSSFTPVEINVLPIYIDKQSIENSRLTFDLHAQYGWRFILLTVGRLAPEKNLTLAINVLSLVKEKFPDTGLLIVGSGPEEGRLKSLVKKLKLQGSVEFAGWQTELASYYKTANVFIQTSLFEGYGLALVEAGLSGLPVVTTPVGIANELEHGREAYIYSPDNAEDFASGVVDLLENNFKRENLKINLKRALDSKLLTKEEFLEEMKKNWQKTATRVHL